LQKIEVSSDGLPVDPDHSPVEQSSMLETPEFRIERASSEDSEDEIMMELSFEMGPGDYVQWRQVALNNALGGDKDTALFLLRL
jgi:hypothetical protein